MRHYHGDPNSCRQPRDPHQRLFRSKTPRTAIERGMEREDRNAVMLGKVPEIVCLMGIPALVHHDLDPVETSL